MEEQWVAFMREARFGPMSIVMNRGYAAAMPDPSRPVVLCFKLRFRDSGENGLGDAAEAGAIDDLSPEVANATGAAYVGRIRGSGKSRNWFYTSADACSVLEAKAKEA